MRSGVERVGAERTGEERRGEDCRGEELSDNVQGVCAFAPIGNDGSSLCPKGIAASLQGIPP